jgi:hypothetical protein
MPEPLLPTMPTVTATNPIDPAYYKYTGGVIAWVWAQSPWVKWYWLNNLRTSGIKPCYGFMVNASPDPAYPTEDVATMAQCCTDLRALGFKAIPGIAPAVSEITTYSQWFDAALWQRIANITTAELPYRDPAFATVLWGDFEPYHITVGQRYPLYADRAALATAMEPWITVLRANNIRPWLYPGGLMSLTDPTSLYVVNDILRTSGVRVNNLISRYYYAFTNSPVNWQLTAKAESTTLYKLKPGTDFTFGLHGGALRTTGFMDQFHAQCWKTAWLFLSASADYYTDFGKLSWYSNPAS